MLQLLFKESVFFSRVPDERVKFSLLRVAHERWGSKSDLRRQDFIACSVVVVLGGHGWFGNGQQEWALRAGATFCFGPGGPHSVRVKPKSPLEIIIVDFFGREAPKLLRQTFKQTRMAAFPVNPDLVCANAQHLFSVARSKQPFAIDICNHLLRALLLNIRAGLVMKTQHVPPAQGTFYVCKRYLDQHFQELSAPLEAAEDAGVSQAHMCRLFRRFADTTPQIYLMRLKMNLAAHLLLASEDSVKQVGLKLGFSDQYAFSKCFKRLVGMAPSHYRVELTG